MIALRSRADAGCTSYRKNRNTAATTTAKETVSVRPTWICWPANRYGVATVHARANGANAYKPRRARVDGG